MTIVICHIIIILFPVLLYYMGRLTYKMSIVFPHKLYLIDWRLPIDLSTSSYYNSIVRAENIIYYYYN